MHSTILQPLNKLFLLLYSLLLGWTFQIALLLVFGVSSPAAVTAQVWTVLIGDAKGDARDSSLADAAQLAYRYDKQADFLWFRVSLYGKPNQQAFGVNIALDTGGAEAAKMNWWGANKTFMFDKLITAWVTHGDNGYQGTIGIADAEGAKARLFNNLLQNNLQIQIEGDSIVIGVKRTDVTDKLSFKLIAAVGSNQEWNDDLPNFSSATVDLSAERPKSGLREIDLSRDNFRLPAAYKILPDNEPPLITKKGRGRQALILVPGMYSGATSFANFIARNQSQYKFYVLTPPGINGTRSRSISGDSFGELTWTRRLERDILDLIRREKLSEPVIVAERQPGSVAAMELAVAHPEKIGGVILISTNLVQFFFSPKDPTRKSAATIQERVASVDEGWGDKWFRYVTPETWENNDLPQAMLSSDVARGQKAWQEIEAAPIQVKIRYLCEFWASDVTRDLDKLQVPVLALLPGFDETFLANPVNSFAKTSILNSWDSLVPKSPKLTLVKIPDARLLLLDDQPQRADGAISVFLQQVGKAPKKR